VGDSIIKLELTLNEVNYILESLADKPYREVFELIGKIKEQATPQVKQERPEQFLTKRDFPK